MLLLDADQQMIEGVQVFADHADPNQFWFCNMQPRLVEAMPGRKAFSLIRYRTEERTSGGFLSFECDLSVDRGVIERITSRLRRFCPGRPKLSPIPFTEGTVQCVVLDLQGSGGTDATTTTDTGETPAVRVVEQILGATKPSLLGDNNAVFGVTLSEEGAAIVEAAIRDGNMPIGIIYDLTFSGMLRALGVKITAELERVHTHFSTSAEGQVAMLRADIDAGFEKLVQDGAITIEVTDADTSDGSKSDERVKWALDFFKDNLLQDWFKPTLTPGTLAGTSASSASLESVRTLGAQLRPPQPELTPPLAEGEDAPAQEARETGPNPAEGTGAEESGNSSDEPDAAAAQETGNPAEGTGFPATPSTEAARSAGNVAAGQSALRNASEGEGDVVAAFAMRTIRQEERKKMVLDYSRSQAVTRTCAPQGQLTDLLGPFDLDRHITLVDTDDAFLAELSVEVDAPFDFTRIGLSRADVALTYGDRSNPETVKEDDFVFKTGGDAVETFTTFLGEDLSRTFELEVQYHFSPDNDWQGETFSYDLPAEQTEDERLHLNPHDHLKFLDIEIAPDELDGGAVKKVEVFLDYEASSGWQASHHVTVKASSEPQRWKVRQLASDVEPYSYRLVYHMIDGGTREVGPVITTATQVPVPNPFPAMLDLLFFPAYNPGDYRRVLLQVQYEDAANSYRRQERIVVEPDAMDVPFKLSVLDPTIKSFTYSATFVGQDGRIARTAPVTTDETMVSILEPEAEEV